MSTPEDEPDISYWDGLEGFDSTGHVPTLGTGDEAVAQVQTGDPEHGRRFMIGGRYFRRFRQPSGIYLDVPEEKLGELSSGQADADTTTEETVRDRTIRSEVAAETIRLAEL